MEEINFLPLLSLLCCDLQLPLLSFSVDLAGSCRRIVWGVRCLLEVMRWGPETFKEMKLNGFKSTLSK